MSSTVAQLETASTRSPLRSDCVNTMPVAFATTSCSCWTSSSDRRLIAPGRAVASRMRKTAIPPPISGVVAPRDVAGCGWRSGPVPVVDQSLDLPGRPGQRLRFHHHDLHAGADGVLDGLGHLGGGRVPAVAGAVRARLHLDGEVVHAALGAEYELEVRGEPGRTQDDLLDLSGEE